MTSDEARETLESLAAERPSELFGDEIEAIHTVLVELGRLNERAELAEGGLKVTAENAEIFKASAERWEGEARRYAQNMNYWRERAEQAEAEVERLEGLILDWDKGDETPMYAISAEAGRIRAEEE